MGRPRPDAAAWERIGHTLQAELRATETARDAALTEAHAIVATCRRAIAAAHRGEHAETARAAAKAHEALRALEARLDATPTLRHGGLLDGARQEVVEAALVAAYVEDARPPAPDALHVPAGAYAQGLGDFVGELRRFTIGSLADDDTDTARRHLRAMQAAYDALQALDAPRGVANVKRAQDLARGLLDRTMGEVTVATAAARIARATTVIDPKG